MADDPFVIAALAVIVLLGLVFLIAAPVRLVWHSYSLVQAVSPPAMLVPAAPASIISSAYLILQLPKLLPLLRHFVPKALCFLLIVYAIAMLWSPEPGTGLVIMSMVTAVLGAILMAHQVQMKTDTDVVRTSMAVLSPVAIVQAVSTVIFQVSPTTEDRYFRSGLFRLLLGDDTADNIFIRPFNIRELDKAGGLFFSNGNRASMVMAVFALVYLSLWLRRRTFTMFALTAICAIGTICSGSKTSYVLAVVIPLAFLLLPGLLRARTNQGWAMIAGLAIVGLVIGLMLFGGDLFERLEGAEDAVGARSKLFSAAAVYFRESPVLGLGFGGWEAHWAADSAAYGLRDSLPPHNFLIAEWANAGILGALILVAILAKLGVDYTRMIRSADTLRNAQAYGLQLGAIAWIVAHGMYDNTWFFGAPNTTTVFALLVVQTIVFNEKNPRQDRGVPRPGRVSKPLATPAR